MTCVSVARRVAFRRSLARRMTSGEAGFGAAAALASPPPGSLPAAPRGRPRRGRAAAARVARRRRARGARRRRAGAAGRRRKRGGTGRERCGRRGGAAAGRDGARGPAPPARGGARSARRLACAPGARRAGGAAGRAPEAARNRAGSAAAGRGGGEAPRRGSRRGASPAPPARGGARGSAGARTRSTAHQITTPRVDGDDPGPSTSNSQMHHERLRTSRLLACWSPRVGADRPADASLEPSTCGTETPRPVRTDEEIETPIASAALEKRCELKPIGNASLALRRLYRCARYLEPPRFTPRRRAEAELQERVCIYENVVRADSRLWKG